MTMFFDPLTDHRPGARQAEDLAKRFKHCVNEHGLHGTIFARCLTVPSHEAHEKRVGRAAVMLWRRDHPETADKHAEVADEERARYERLARMVLSV